MDRTKSFSRTLIPAFAATALGLSAVIGFGAGGQAHADSARGSYVTGYFAMDVDVPRAHGGNVEFEWKVEEGESAPRSIPAYSIVIDTRPAGGNVEFEWKVEEGESSISEVGGLKYEMDVVEGGNVEFEWKVEEGESSISEVGGLKYEMDDVEGGNIEFEWKVEEGES